MILLLVLVYYLVILMAVNVVHWAIKAIMSTHIVILSWYIVVVVGG